MSLTALQNNDVIAMINEEFENTILEKKISDLAFRAFNEELKSVFLIGEGNLPNNKEDWSTLLAGAKPSAAYQEFESAIKEVKQPIQEALATLWGPTMQAGYLLPRSLKAVLTSRTYVGQRLRAAYYFARNRIVPALLKMGRWAKGIGQRALAVGRTITFSAAKPFLARLGLYGIGALIVYGVWKYNAKGIDVFGGVGGISKGHKDHKKTLMASNWKFWPKEVQCKWCARYNRKPKNHKTGEEAEGPSCEELDCENVDLMSMPDDAPNMSVDPGGASSSQPSTGGSGCGCSRLAKMIQGNLDLGSNRKAAFKTLQNYLAAAGYAELMPRTFKSGPKDPDGMCGSETKRAVRKFQKDNGLQVDGCYGPKTHAKMQQVLKGLKGSEQANTNPFGVVGPEGEPLTLDGGTFKK
tara:strand:- start:16018 stop:17247 length:1230 start_codon:yes stop_codon:yes gene_type:complete